ncbi:hypothetical protein [Pseudoxanthomonas sp. JBR18]|uniref:hypothetical protein n=1 Tax=Pseudoxanthomonas sp. JBR18 TaxID=2969308 RepID=UPI002304F46A|nr:hypothetical protein [Pseudoxanthomonas sp. JBR18]WCE06161.1 hypothetical protein PJ250_09535 [Pseudoxanthomonas sp. JBR18]
MTLLYLCCSLLAALAFYAATAHQRLRPSLRAHARALRWLGTALCGVALAAGIAALGPLAGVSSALTALMLGMVALPYLDAWRPGPGGTRDVG